jgi:hypothetical protein
MHILRKQAQAWRIYIRQIRDVESAHPAQYTPELGMAVCAVAVPSKSSKERAMLTRTNRLRIMVVIAVLVVTGTKLGNAAAQKAAVPKPQNKLAIGEDEVKQLLPLMDTDKRGMVSRQEFMKFMEAEFERLDKNKKGELNVKELTQSTLTANRLAGK